jgi:hypothetical protein
MMLSFLQLLLQLHHSSILTTELRQLGGFESSTLVTLEADTGLPFIDFHSFKSKGIGYGIETLL